MTGELKPWRPFGSIASLRRDMDHLWDRFFSTDPSIRPWEKGWVPSLDVSETKDKLIVKTEIAGVDPKEIDIKISGDILTIKGEKKEEKQEKDENYHLMERRYGAFSRSIQLPMEVNEKKIKANYKNGVLKITLPKSGKSKAKAAKIAIE
jgi:HSP20 family protein